MSVDQFPSHWKILPLTESVDALIDYRGKTPTKTESGIPLITAKIVKGGTILPVTEFIAEEDYESWMVRGLPQAGDIVVTTEAPLGEVAQLTDSNVALAQRIVTLRGAEGLLSNDYLRYVMQGAYVQEQLEARASGSTVKGIRQSELRKILIPIPPLSEQSIISVHLKSIENKIQLNQQINQTLEQMAQAIFKSWFVDFEPVKAKMAALEAGGSEDDALLAAMQAIAGSALFTTDIADTDAPTQLARLQAEHPEQYATLRATAELFPSAMQESELGEVPEGWSVCQVENILERLKPVKRYTKKEVSSTGLVPVFEQGADILLGFHNEKAGFTADAKNPAFVFGDHTCITHLSCQDFDISQNVIPLRGRNRSTIWVYYAIQGKQAFQEYRRHWSELIVKPVIYPTRDICERYSETVLRMICFKESLERENRSLAELRDTLLPKLLSGELSVSAATDQITQAEEAIDV